MNLKNESKKNEETHNAKIIENYETVEVLIVLEGKLNT